MPTLTQSNINYIQNKFDALATLIRKRGKFEKQIKTEFKTTLDFSDINGGCLIHYAVILGDLKMVKLLQKERASLSIKHKQIDRTPLQLAYEYGHQNIVDYLLQYVDISDASRADIDLPEMLEDYDQRVEHQKLKPLLRFLNHNPIPFLSKTENKSNLNYAVEIGNLFFLNQFLAQFPDKNLLKIKIQSHLQAKDGIENPLIVAVKNKQYLALDILLEHIDADIGPISMIDGKAVQHDYFTSALHVAASMGDWESAEKLIQHGANVDLQNKHGYTALHMALVNGHEDFAVKLMQFDPCLEVVTFAGDTIFHAASQHSKELRETLQSNIKNPALISQANIYGLLPGDEPLEKTYDQNSFLYQLEYYLALNYRSKDYFTNEGMCNGFGFVYNVFSSLQNQTQYYSLLDNIKKWTGDETQLNMPVTDDLKDRFSTLRELFEALLSELSWYQHNTNLTHKNPSPTLIKQHERHKQFDGQLTYLLENYEIEINEYTQLLEYNEIFCRLPNKIFMEFSVARHLTTGKTLYGESIEYYDSNFHTLIDAQNPAQFTQLILNVAKCFQGRDYQLPIEFSLYHFDWNHIDLSQYEYFTEAELPSTMTEAKSFQDSSPNQLTHLHIAALTHSQINVIELLTQGYCNINTKDAHDMTALDIAAHSGDVDFCELFLNHDNIDLDNPYAAEIAFHLGHFNLLHTIIEHPKSCNLYNLTELVIIKNKTEIAKELLLRKKVSVSDYLTICTKQKRMDLIEEFFNYTLKEITFSLCDFNIVKFLSNCESDPQTFTLAKRIRFHQRFFQYLCLSMPFDQAWRIPNMLISSPTDREILMRNILPLCPLSPKSILDLLEVCLISTNQENEDAIDLILELLCTVPQLDLSQLIKIFKLTDQYQLPEKYLLDLMEKFSHQDHLSIHDTVLLFDEIYQTHFSFETKDNLYTTIFDNMNARLTHMEKTAEVLLNHFIATDKPELVEKIKAYLPREYATTSRLTS